MGDCKLGLAARFAAAVLGLAVAGPALADEVPAQRPLLVTYGPKAAILEGDHDFAQTITFSVPANLEGKLFLRIFDPDANNRFDTPFGVWGDTVTRFTLSGGVGAFVGSGAGLAGGVVAGGDVLFAKSYGKDHGTDGIWRTLTSFDAGAGELRGERRFFRVDVEGVRGNDGNVFDIAVSTKTKENAAPWGLAMVSYLPTLRVPDDATLVEMRFRVPGDATALTVNNFDASGGEVFFTSRYRSVRLAASGQGVWDKSTFDVMPDERGTLAALTVAGGGEIPNDLSIYVTDASGAAVPLRLPLRAWAGNNRPVIVARATPAGCGGMVFDASGTSDADGDALSYLWRFGDGRVLQGVRVERSFAPGDYSARLEVRDGSGLVGDGAAKMLDFTVKAQPVARIAGPAVVALGAPVRFDGSGSTTGARWSIAAYEWMFPDGATATGAAVTQIFAKRGPQTVRLKVRDDSGHPCDRAQTQFGVWVNAGPVALVTPQSPVAVGQAITFDGAGSSDDDGDVLAYAWGFGDGGTGTGATVSHAFKAPGTYRVVLGVDDGAGVVNSVARTAMMVRVNAPPVANPGDDLTVAVGETIRFDGSGSTDADGNILSYAWGFGDGSKASGIAPVYAFPRTGQYQVRLTVRDDAGLANSANTATMTVTVTDAANLAPVADAGPAREVIVGSQVTFDATGSADPDGNIIAYDWDFGDGGRATGLAPTHSFWRTGRYRVTLQVTDASGLGNNTASASATVTVIDAPNTAPTAAPGPDRTVKVGEIITFNAGQSSDPDGNIIAYQWDFGNGDTARGVTPPYAYQTPGRYQVRLTVTDGTGRDAKSATGSATITVVPLKTSANAGERQ